MSVGTYFGIPVKIHWTFGYILFYIAYVGYSENLGVKGASWFGLFILSLFLCVVLHEYGHALAARRYGVKTLDIILTPLGGIARLMKMPEKPVQELIVALAGPAVNVVIALLIGTGLYFFATRDFIILDETLFDFSGNPVKFLIALMWVNITLLLFNLLPVFPMDGGRVLRSLIAMRWSKLTATRVAARLGQTFAVGFVIIGLYTGQITLPLIGLFIFQGAYMELRMANTESALRSYSISNLIVTEFQSLLHDDYINNAREMLHYTNQHIFPVYRESMIIGSVTRDQVLQSPSGMDFITSLKIKPVHPVKKEALYLDVYNVFAGDGIDLCVVMEDGRIAGILDKFTYYEALVRINVIKRARKNP